MRSSLFRRTFWLVFSLWFGPSLVVPELTDLCPVHRTTAGMSAHAGHGAMAGHGRQAPEHASHRGCICPGEGCGTTTATLPIGVSRSFGRVRFVLAASVSSNDDRLPSASADLLLPPTTGPPPRA